jgi:hypothetical protein
MGGFAPIDFAVVFVVVTAAFVVAELAATSVEGTSPSQFAIRNSPAALPPPGK